MKKAHVSTAPAAKKKSKNDTQQSRTATSNELIQRNARVADLSGKSMDSFPTQLPSSLLAIDLQRNALQTMNNVCSLRLLVEINLSHNSIAKIEGLHTAVSLEYIDLSHNMIASVEGLECAACLKYLNLSSNRVTSLPSLGILTFNPHLSELWVAENPCATRADYRAAVCNLLPSLLALDGRVCRPHVLGSGYEKKFRLTHRSSSRMGRSSGDRRASIPRSVLSEADPLVAITPPPAPHPATLVIVPAAVEPAAVAVDKNTPTPVVPTARGWNTSMRVGGDVGGREDRLEQRHSRMRAVAVPRVPAAKATTNAVPVPVPVAEHVPEKVWLSPAINKLCREGLDSVPETDAYLSLDIASLRMQLRRDSDSRGEDVDSVVPAIIRGPPSPTKAATARKAYVDEMLLLRDQTRELHLLQCTSKLPVESLFRPRPQAVSPPPSPTRASHMRSAHNQWLVSARREATDEQEALMSQRMPSPCGSVRSSTPPPSPTRATQARRGHIAGVLDERRREVDWREEQLRANESSLWRRTQQDKTRTIKLSSEETQLRHQTFSPRNRSDGNDNNSFLSGNTNTRREREEHTAEAEFGLEPAAASYHVTSRGGGGSDGGGVVDGDVSNLLQQLMRSKLSTLQLVRRSKEGTNSL